MSARDDKKSETTIKSPFPSRKSGVASEDRPASEASSAASDTRSSSHQDEEPYMVSGALPVATCETRESSEPDPDRPVQSIEKRPRAPTPTLSDLDRTPTDSDKDPQSPGIGFDDKYLTGKRKKRRPMSSPGSSNGAAPPAKRQEQASSDEEL